MFDKPQGFDQVAGMDQGAPWPAVPDAVETPPPPVRTPRRWSLTNWPVRRKVVAIVLAPLLLAAVFGGLRIYAAAVDATDLRLAADRSELVPAINNYMAALQNAMVTVTAEGDSTAATAEFDTRRTELQQRLNATNVVPNVRLAVTTLIDQGKAVLDRTKANEINLRQRVTIFAPLLLTAETAITGSVRVDDEAIRLEAEGLSRAVGARGQMAMQKMLVDRGGELPEPELRSSMIALAGTEPSTVMGMGALLGGASAEASELRTQMVQRLSMMSDPSVPLVGNEQMLQSIGVTDQIAQKVVDSTTNDIISKVDAEATHQLRNSIRDGVIVLAALLIALAIVWWVARSLTRPLRRLRDGALKIAHENLAAEIERVKAGDEREPEPLPIHTTEEVGQVAHAVDELHAQALLLAGDEARLRVMVNDMFETLSRRNKSLVDQQLSLIDRLERNEEDADRLDSLFRLDHLATRMRRNGANLLVLAGAQVAREQSVPVPLSSLINAAASEVEDYQRVETGGVPDCALTGAVAGDSVHLLAELIDNALRYSPPTSRVRVTAVHTSDAGVLIDVDDAGLGMTESDLRIANMRLNAGAEVSPDNARHMGLFVVGRLAQQHGMVVRLLPAASGTGTVAQVYLPPTLLDGYSPPEVHEDVPAATFPALPEFAGYTETEYAQPEPAVVVPASAEPEAADASVTLLPRRSPGSSGITGAPMERPFGESAESEEEAWLKPAEEPAHDASEDPAEVPRSNTARFFASRRRAVEAPQAELTDMDVEREAEQEHQVQRDLEEPAAASEDTAGLAEETADVEHQVEHEVSYEVASDERVDTGSIDLSDMDRLADQLSPHAGSSGVDLIYQNMISEWLVDPQELPVSQDWKSVWDNGWAAAAEADSVPIEAHTNHGLPVRAPGARLVPGGAPEGDNGHPTNGIDHGPTGQQREPAADGSGEYGALERDPDAIRASMSNHFGGVHAARSHTGNTNQGLDDQ